MPIQHEQEDPPMLCVWIALLTGLIRSCQHKPPSGTSDFGQSNFDQSIFGQNLCFCGFTIRGGPEGVGAPKGGGPKILCFFFPLPPQFSFFSPFRSFCVSLGSSRGILVVFGSAGAVKCARLEFLGCRVKPRRLAGPKKKQGEKNKGQHKGQHGTNGRIGHPKLMLTAVGQDVHGAQKMARGWGCSEQRGKRPIQEGAWLESSQQWCRVGVSPAAAVRVAWERYVGRIGGRVPTFLHADLTLAVEPVVSTQSQKKANTVKARADTPSRDRCVSVVNKHLTRLFKRQKNNIWDK